MKQLKYVLSAIFLLGFCSIASGATSQSELVAHSEHAHWLKVNAMSGKCKIAFPEMPQHMQQMMPLEEENQQLKYDVYVAGLEAEAVYMVLIAEYPTSIDEGYAEMSLESFLNGILTQNPNNRLIFADLTQVDGHKALDFFIRTKGVYFKGRAIMADNSLYLLAMECEMQNYSETNYNYFINSFEFIN